MWRTINRSQLTLTFFCIVLFVMPTLDFRRVLLISASIHVKKWAVLKTVLRNMQEVMLRTSLDNSQLNYGIVFECRTNSNRNLGHQASFALQLGDMGGFKRLDSRRKIALFLHGWHDEGSVQWVQEMLRVWTYFQQNYNVCVVDWGNLSQMDYKAATMSIFDVGLTVAGIIMALERLRPGKFTRRNVTIAGYSLGAHAAGYAGAVLDGQLEQIIGLDPAGPLFTLPAVVSTKYRLDPTDAQFVQVLHTSSGTLGTSLKCGHADFYPNGGIVPQSNCEMSFPNLQDFSNTNPIGCSHSSAALFFKQSMDPEYPFIGYKCLSYEHFLKGECFKNRRARFGVHSRKIARGNYYFQTLSQRPYVQRKPRNSQKKRIRCCRKRTRLFRKYLNCSFML